MTPDSSWLMANAWMMDLVVFQDGRRLRLADEWGRVRLQAVG